MLNLDAYKSVQSNLLVRIEISPTNILRFSDKNISVDYNNETYFGLGRLMGVTSSTSELRVSGSEVTITVSGIPNSSISEILNTKIKGASVKIYRAFFDSQQYGTLLPVSGNPMGRFTGYVNNYSLVEEYDTETRTSSNSIIMTCSSVVDVLNNKLAGRKTNPSSQKRFFPNDLSMDRVPSLESATFNFGGK